jgi:hypothetical protein
MPTMLWFPEILEHSSNFEKWFTNPKNNVNITLKKRY